MQLVDKLKTKAKEGNADSVIRNSTKIAQLYFTHKLVTVNMLYYS